VSQHPKNAHSLSIFDAAAIIIGIVIGPGIFETGPSVAQSFSHLSGLVGIWLLGGFLSFTGVLCYAELAERYPTNAGEYVWLREALHPRLANTFLWAEVTIIRPGAIAAMAFPAATYLQASIPGLHTSSSVSAACIVIATTAVNLLGFRASRMLQNLLSGVKILSLCAIIAAGFCMTHPSTTTETPTLTAAAPNYGLALILVLFTFGGWNEIVNVTADVRGGARSVYKAAILSLITITALYALITIAYVNLLGLSLFSASSLPIVIGLQGALPGGAATVVSLLITIACLGAIQGMIFSGARLYCRFLEIFRGTAQLTNTAKAPNLSLPYALQMLLSIVIIFVAGTFSSAVVYTTTIVWLCFLLRGLCVPVIRAKYGPPTSLAVPLYPLPVLIFCVSCLYLIWSACAYSPWGTAISVTIAAVGLFLSPSRSAGRGNPT
jgi:amino acid transporter